MKIFDLGLAREFGLAEKTSDGMYKMSADTGSPRYMAPEVALGKPYNEKVDTYSFGILLWEMLALEAAFEGFTMNMFKKKIIEGGCRPVPDKKWPVDIQKLLRRSWSKNTNRPSMDECQIVLRDEINRISDDEVNEEMDVSRRSEISLRGFARALE